MRLTEREQRAFGVGVAAALLATVAMAALRFWLDAPSLPEALAEFILALLPASVFAVVLDALGRAAKPLLYLCIGLGQLLVGGALAVVYARSRPGWWTALLIAAGLWAGFGMVVFPLAGYGPLASALRGGPLLSLIALPLSLLVYAAFLVWGARALVPDERPWTTAGGGPAAFAHERRAFMLRLGAGLAGLGAALAAGLLAGPRVRRDEEGVAAVAPLATAESGASPTVAAPTNAMAAGVKQPEGTPPAATLGPALPPEFQVPGLAREVTPNSEHYVVSKNFVDPVVDPAFWKLVVDGRVRQKLELRLADIRKLPQVSNYYTLECISNEVGGDLIGTARWTGVRLRDVIERAGPLDGVVDVELGAEDDYVESIPLEAALRPDTVIALEMNGERLPDSHGYPARLIVPGIFGMKNVKWLNRVTLVEQDVKGFWQQRGWSDVATYQTMSRIDVPRSGEGVGRGPQVAAGIAFAGDRRVQRVEVSFDGGQTWREARLKSPLSPFTWVLWVAPWEAAASGGGTIMVRATDGRGEVQTAEARGTVPDGATGYHQIAFYVR